MVDEIEKLNTEFTKLYRKAQIIEIKIKIADLENEAKRKGVNL